MGMEKQDKASVKAKMHALPQQMASMSIYNLKVTNQI